ncbi:MAG: hypothetical protein WBC93_04930 [Sulfitobacter sp.]
MADRSPLKGPGKTGQTREDRLKAALKANLGRRKAQTRARNAPADGQTASEAHKNRPQAGQDKE